MRARVALLLTLATVFVALPHPAAATPERSRTTLAQGTGAQTGAQDDSEGASEETGPPWTYQMARVTVVLLVLLAAGIGLMYRRLIVRRSRGES